MGNPGKAWEIPGKHWIFRVSMGNPGKAWKIPRNLGKAQEIPGKAVKSWEMLLKPGNFRAFFLVLHSYKTTPNLWYAL